MNLSTLEEITVSNLLLDKNLFSISFSKLTICLESNFNKHMDKYRP